MPTAPSTITSLGWAQQTAFVNTVKAPAGALTQLFFGDREQTLFTETAELSYREGERYLAPFVEVNGEAVAVGSRSTTFANVSCPNIRMKRPMDAYQSFVRRLPNTDLFINSGDVVRAAREAAIAEDSAYMAELAQNRTEWMVAQLLTSSMTTGYMELKYDTTVVAQASERANFRIRIPQSTDMKVAPAVLWTSPSTANPVADFLLAKRRISKWLSVPTAGCVMDPVAADLFLAIPGVKDLLDKRNVSAGVLNLEAQFGENGMILHGVFCGVPIWEYGREYVDEDGTTKLFFGGSATAPGRVLFWGGGNALAENKILYGAIPDHGAFDTGAFVGKRFSKSWKTEDPSVYTQLLQTRPLPLIRKPNAFLLMDVN